MSLCKHGMDFRDEIDPRGLCAECDDYAMEERSEAEEFYVSCRRMDRTLPEWDNLPTVAQRALKQAAKMVNNLFRSVEGNIACEKPPRQ